MPDAEGNVTFIAPNEFRLVDGQWEVFPVRLVFDYVLGEYWAGVFCWNPRDFGRPTNTEPVQSVHSQIHHIRGSIGYSTVTIPELWLTGMRYFQNVIEDRAAVLTDRSVLEFERVTAPAELRTLHESLSEQLIAVAEDRYGALDGGNRADAVAAKIADLDLSGHHPFFQIVRGKYVEAITGDGTMQHWLWDMLAPGYDEPINAEVDTATFEACQQCIDTHGRGSVCMDVHWLFQLASSLVLLEALPEG